MAIILALNSHSLRLRLGSCEGVAGRGGGGGGGGGSCGETNTGISVCSSSRLHYYSYVLFVYCVFTFFLLRPFLWVRSQWL